MKETTGEMNFGNQELEQTLPGLGPKVGIDLLESRAGNCLRMVLTEEEQAMLDVMRGQADRYDWFASRVDAGKPIEHFAAVLLRERSGPGLWEEALVALSQSRDEVAYTLLEQWQPPADDPEMCLFHEICLSRARCRPGFLS